MHAGSEIFQTWQAAASLWRHSLGAVEGTGLQDLSEDVHMWLAYGMLAVAVGHLAAAFRHRWIDGHDVIRRMTFGGPQGVAGPAPGARRARRPATASTGARRP